jgi:hypothetical protein
MNAVKTPAGGTWAWISFISNSAADFISGDSYYLLSGIAAGGTAVNAGKGYGDYGCGLFCWRIA